MSIVIENFIGLKEATGLSGKIHIHDLVKHLNKKPRVLDNELGKRKFKPCVVFRRLDDDDGTLVLELWHDNENKPRSYSTFFFESKV